MRDFDQHGQPICPECKAATAAVYATVPNLPCWKCGAKLPEPNLPSRRNKPPRFADGCAFLSCGDTFYLEKLTPGIRKKFSQYAKLMALQEIQEDKDAIDEELYRERMTNFEENCAAGAYRWGSPYDSPQSGNDKKRARAGSGVSRILGTPDGFAHMVRLLLAREHGDIEPERVEEIMQDNPDGFRVAYREAMRLDPLDRRPLETAEPMMTTETASETITPAA